MTVKTIDRWLRLVQLKITLHGLWGCGGEWFRLRNNLRRERKRSIGRADCLAGGGCTSADGSYLEGYHDGDAETFRYVMWSQLEGLQ
jgi:hypothetical protein